MTTQPDLFGSPVHDPRPVSRAEVGAALRDEAVQRADDNADATWRRLARLAIRGLAHTQTEFTTDAVWDRLGEAGQVATTHEPRALGALMREAQSAGLIRPTAAHRLSQRPQAHRRPMRVWQSLVCHG